MPQEERHIHHRLFQRGDWPERPEWTLWEILEEARRAREEEKSA